MSDPPPSLVPFFGTVAVSSFVLGFLGTMTVALARYPVVDPARAGPVAKYFAGAAPEIEFVLVVLSVLLVGAVTVVAAVVAHDAGGADREMSRWLLASLGIVPAALLVGLVVGDVLVPSVVFVALLGLVVLLYLDVSAFLLVRRQSRLSVATILSLLVLLSFCLGVAIPVTTGLDEVVREEIVETRDEPTDIDAGGQASLGDSGWTFPGSISVVAPSSAGGASVPVLPPAGVD